MNKESECGGLTWPNKWHPFSSSSCCELIERDKRSKEGRDQYNFISNGSARESGLDDFAKWIS